MLTSAAIILSIALALAAGDPSGTGGGTVDSWTGTIDNTDVVLSGDSSTDGTIGSETTGTGTNGSGNSDDSSSEPPPAPRFSCKDGGAPDAITPCDPVETTTEPGTPAVTLSDIARFRPAPGRQSMEPDGWVVVGLPANIYAVVAPQIVPGVLLGDSADVRFTPVGYNWDYGDGTSTTLATKGATWSALGLREFDATPTSHIYRAAGDYTIRLGIVYRAEYRIAGGAFIPIAGTIALPANELYITAGGAKTVLVDRDCTLAPSGPGC